MPHNPPEPLDWPYAQTALTRRQSSELICAPCQRYVIVDMVRALDQWGDAFGPEHLRRARCTTCGEKMKTGAGIRIGAMQFTGKMPRMVVTDGSNWFRPPFRPPAPRRPSDPAWRCPP